MSANGEGEGQLPVHNKNIFIFKKMMQNVPKRKNKYLFLFFIFILSKSYMYSIPINTFFFLVSAKNLRQNFSDMSNNILSYWRLPIGKAQRIF